MKHNINDLIPHRPPMQLVDEFIGFNNETVHCRAKITDKHLFLSNDKNSIPHWIGIEIMAQTAGTYAKIKALNVGLKQEEPNIAFLLSVRNYKANIKEYHIGSILDIYAECIILDNGTGVFNCRIEIANQVVSSMTISAHQPQNIEDANKIIKRG